MSTVSQQSRGEKNHERNNLYRHRLARNRRAAALRREGPRVAGTRDPDDDVVEPARGRGRRAFSVRDLADTMRLGVFPRTATLACREFVL